MALSCPAQAQALHPLIWVSPARPPPRRPRDRPCAARRWRVPSATLLDLDGGAGLLELALELVGLLALDALLHGLRRLVDERLRLLEAQAGGRADDLDHLDLLVAGAGEDDVDGGGHLLGGATVAGRGTSRCRSGG